MIRCVKHFLVILAVLAVGAAQTMGFSRGYLCECSGAPVQVGSADCDAGQCHPGSGHHDHEDGEGGHHEHQHKKVTEAIKTVSFAPLTLSLPTEAGADISELIAAAFRLMCQCEEHGAAVKPPDDTGGNLPAGLMVARTVVMLV